MECLLCGEDRILCNSHIVPEFLYKHLYNDARKLMAISGQGNKGWKPLQKGVRDHLLCTDCECRINDNYEKPFLEQWETTSPLPLEIELDQVYTGNYDYTTFKLFHLSVLFRASISSLPSFRATCLGQKHEQCIRDMLLNKDPGKHAEYPIIGFIVVNNQGKREQRFISVPFPSRYENHQIYGQVYGGVVWWVSVSSYKNANFQQIGLQENGAMSFYTETIDKIVQAKVAGMLLRKENL